eukprot:2043682-Alexandrium_andersonii.AAC.1
MSERRHPFEYHALNQSLAPVRLALAGLCPFPCAPQHRASDRSTQHLAPYPDGNSMHVDGNA